MKEKLGFEKLIGEKIIKVIHTTIKKYDDDGDIILITKKKKFKIQGYYDSYTGKSIDEYPTRLSCNEIIDKCDCGFFEGKRGECVCGKRWCK